MLAPSEGTLKAHPVIWMSVPLVIAKPTSVASVGEISQSEKVTPEALPWKHALIPGPDTNLEFENLEETNDPELSPWISQSVMSRIVVSTASTAAKETPPVSVIDKFDNEALVPGLVNEKDPAAVQRIIVAYLPSPTIETLESMDTLEAARSYVPSFMYKIPPLVGIDPSAATMASLAVPDVVVLKSPHEDTPSPTETVCALEGSMPPDLEKCSVVEKSLGGARVPRRSRDPAPYFISSI